MSALLSLNSYHYRRGGSDAVYLDHAELFAAHGWEARFLSMHHPRNLPCDDEAFFARMVDHEFAEGLVDKLRIARASVYNAEAKRKAADMVRQKPIDVAHVHCIYHHLTPSVLEPLAEAGIPIFLTAHDLKIACPAYTMRNGQGEICEQCKGGRYYNALKNRCTKGSRMASGVVALEAYVHDRRKSYAKHLEGVIAPSRFYAAKLAEWGFPAERIHYVPNFTRKIDPAFADGYKAPILFFGRLSNEKGIDTLIEAAKIANVAVDIVGSGPHEEALRAHALRIDAPVTFHGRQDGDKLWQFVGRTRAVVLPSEWYENAPLALLEAFQLEKPAIGARIGGIPELVEPPEHDACGWLFRSGDARDLAKTLATVADADDRELRERGQAGRALALDRFDKETYYRAVSDLYEISGVPVPATGS